LKLRVETDGEEYYLDLRREGSEATYKLQAAETGAKSASGIASIVETQTGVYSVLLSAKGADARRQTGQELVSPLGGKLDTPPVLREFLQSNRSFEVRIAGSGDPVEVWVGQKRYLISQADARDSPGRRKSASAVGPREIRAQMPGKVITIMVSPGDRVKSGQGLIIVEAMKMQNEMRSPKDGVVFKIQAAAGATVAQGEVLMVIE
jgi:biotin carboxyl carrier protein